MITHADRRRDVPRKEALLARRIRQRSARAGFTPVVNNRTQAEFTSLRVSGMSEGQAWAAIARTLPAAPIGVRVRPYAKR